jgi:hypothetical protein
MHVNGLPPPHRFPQYPNFLILQAYVIGRGNSKQGTRCPTIAPTTAISTPAHFPILLPAPLPSILATMVVMVVGSHGEVVVSWGLRVHGRLWPRVKSTTRRWEIRRGGGREGGEAIGG